MAKERDAFFDNYKAFLIVMVVFGHFLNYPANRNVAFAGILRNYIYLFHVPAFVFISGYFAHKTKVSKLIKSLLLPYFILQIIYYFVYHQVGHNVQFRLIWPYFTLWYLIALFIWRMIINLFGKNKALIPISFLVSIFVPYIAPMRHFFSLFRVISFFPYFVLGNHLDIDKWKEISSKPKAKIISIFFLLIMFAFTCLYYKNFNVEVLNCQMSYSQMGLPVIGGLARVQIILFALAFIFAFGCLMPKGNTIFTTLGQRTMRVYILHGFVYKTLSYGTGVFDLVNNAFSLCVYLILLIILAYLLQYEPIDNLLNWICSIPEKVYYKWKEHFLVRM